MSENEPERECSWTANLKANVFEPLTSCRGNRPIFAEDS